MGVQAAFCVRKAQQGNECQYGGACLHDGGAAFVGGGDEQKAACNDDAAQSAAQESVRQPQCVGTAAGQQARTDARTQTQRKAQVIHA